MWKVQPDFSLPLIVKCKNEKLRKELVDKKERALALENSQSFQIAHSGEKTKSGRRAFW